MTLREAEKLPFMMIVLGHETLYGTSLSFEDAVRFLEPLDPEYVLASSGFLTSLAVHDESDTYGQTLTAETLQLLFPRDRIERFNNKRAQFLRRGRKVLVASEHALTVLARIALLKSRGQLQPFANEEWQKKISSALLAINDFANTPATVEAIDGKWAPGQQLLAYRMFLPQHAATYTEDSINAFARAKRMFFELPSEMRDDRDWIDFPSVIEATFGVTMRELLMCSNYLTWAFATQVATRKPRSIPIKTLTDFGIEPRVVDAAMKIYAQTFEEAVAAEQKFMAQNGRFEPFDARSFLTKPIVRFGDRMVAPSNRLIGKQANIGLYYTLLDAVPSEKKKSQAFFNFTGRIFEQYSHQLAERIASASGAHYVKEPLPDATGKRIDGAVVDRDGAATLLEYKGGMFNLSAGMHAEADAFEKSFDSIIMKAVIQLRDTLRALRAGAQLVEGRPVTPRFAVVITQYPFSTDFMLESLVHERMAARGESMTEFDGVPLLFMHAGEFERLEMILASRSWRLAILLEDWARDHPRVSFHNFAFTKGLLGVDRNPLLAQIADEWIKPWTDRINELAAAEEMREKQIDK